jgi:hypothetical protein
MCLHNYRDAGSFRTRLQPPRAPIVVERESCRISTAPGEVDPTPLAYLLPPPVAARLPHDYEIHLSKLAAVDEVARALYEGAAPREGDGYRLSARPPPAPPASSSA